MDRAGTLVVLKKLSKAIRINYQRTARIQTNKGFGKEGIQKYDRKYHFLVLYSFLKEKEELTLVFIANLSMI